MPQGSAVGELGIQVLAELDRSCFSYVYIALVYFSVPGSQPGSLPLTHNIEGLCSQGNRVIGSSPIKKY